MLKAEIMMAVGKVYKIAAKLFALADGVVVAAVDRLGKRLKPGVVLYYW